MAAEVSSDKASPHRAWLPASRRGRTGHNTVLTTAAVLAVITQSMPVHAQTAWTGTNSSDWFDPGNWTAGVPTNADFAEIDTVVNSLPAIEGGSAEALRTFVGLSANGVLTIQNGGSLTNDRGFIGQNLNASGAVSVIGIGASWVSTSNLVIGNLGQGSLSVVNGGAVSSNDTFLGAGPDAFGSATVAGTGSIWTATGSFVVGDSGTGTINIDNGGKLSSSDAELGDAGGSSGSVNVTGDGSYWESVGILTIGNGGDGAISILDGGRISSEHSLFAEAPGSTAEALISGEGSEWITSGNFIVGIQGEADVIIHGGGAVQATSSVIGFDTGSSGLIVVTDKGSTFSVTDGIHVGGSGEGGLVAVAGGVIQSAQGILANTPDSFAGAAVTGSGSAWLNSGSLRVGNSGTAELRVEDGGRLTSAGADIANFSTSQASVSITGAGSTWDNSGYLNVGGAGNGTLAILKGGRASDGNATVAAEAGSTGAVLVTDSGSQWVNAGALFVGFEGNGALTIQNGAVVSAEDASLGAHAGSLGVVTVTGSGSSWLNSGDLHVAGEGQGRLNIAGGAVVKAAGTTFIGTLAGSEGTLNIGAASGLAPLAPGLLETTKLVFGEGTGALVFNHTAADYLFAPAIEGGGTIDVLSGTTLLSADSSGFTGQATVDDGATLIVNGRLGGALDVLAGGRLQGSGTVGSTAIAGGATIAPGNSIGTLNVAGDLIFHAGSIYEVEVNPGDTDADLIRATGIVTLNGGAVAHVGLEGTYRPFSTYEIIAADGGVSGTFDGVTSDFAFLDPSLSYDPNSVFLTLVRNDVSFCEVGVTPNQCATGEGVESLGSGKLYDAVVVLDEDTARGAFDLLSGEIHASAKTALIEDSRFVRDAATNRIRAAFGGASSAAAPVFAYGPGGPEPAAAGTERFAVWGQAFGSWGNWDGDGNAASMDRSIGGFFLGGDMLAAENLRLGLLAGYSRSNFEVDSRASSGSSDSFHLGAYGGSQWGAWGLRFGGAYSWHEIDVSRVVAFPGFSDSLTGNYDAATGQAFGEAGYRFSVGSAHVEPFASLAYVNLHTDGFTESGAAAALAAEGQRTDTTFMTLGARAEMKFGEAEATKLTGMIGWRHAFGDDVPTSTMAFSGGDVFTIAGVPIAEDALVLEAGLDVAVSQTISLGISYSGQIASQASDHGLRADFSAKF
ncbi:autotransporter domain-containing protein [Mesorhizobium sp. BAC0120]|uniref:autotransporter domain-containing protein n=1 Tax=Mesorhizobium sp. BAC0120 TaxID=3090670 RepID=UPI00298C6BEB|nr:autotransporter domain-containing protein [Mesorhizobium sp. BAC0120]MDW6025493.1 autotransporter domain-containing protein [Mesorhizobium sp. BAC0120]